MAFGTAIAAIYVFLTLSPITFQEHKGVLYSKPKGWEEAVEGDAKVLAPASLKEGDVLAIILTPPALVTTEPQKQQFLASVTSANEGVKVLSQTAVIERLSTEINFYLLTMTCEAQGIGKHSRLYAMVFSQTQRSLIVVLANKDELFDKYAEDVTNFISSIKFKEVSKPKTDPASGSAGVSKIPTGNTPGLYAGMPGWLPSGRGLPIPAASVTSGAIQGLWYRVETGTDGLVNPDIYFYSSSGIKASNIRLGGPKLYDFEGQKNQPGETGVGTYSISNGKFITTYNGHEFRSAFTTGKDSAGIFFKNGQDVFRPLAPVTKANIVGSWKSLGTQYIFSSDGRYEMGTIMSNGDWTAGGTTRGTYVFDGYLLMTVVDGGPIIINKAGMGGTLLLIGNRFFVRS